MPPRRPSSSGGPAATGCGAPTAAPRSTASPASAQEHHHRQPFTIDADHPEIFAAEDNGATPVEIVLAALAAA